MECKWTKTKHADTTYYKTVCGNTFVFNNGGPTDNMFKYCPYCGGKITTEKASNAPDNPR